MRTEKVKINRETIYERMRRIYEEAYDEGKQDVVGIITDETTGANCLKKKFKCCGFHEACENILKRVEKL